MAEPLPDGIYRDRRGIVRLVEPVMTLERLMKGATDKIRQAAKGMPAIYFAVQTGMRKQPAFGRGAGGAGDASRASEVAPGG